MNRWQRINIQTILFGLAVCLLLSVAALFFGTFFFIDLPTEEQAGHARNLSDVRLALVDGMKLAEYIYPYDFGMQTEQGFSIKKLDIDYWGTLIGRAV